jgi:hypothetical protein
MILCPMKTSHPIHVSSKVDVLVNGRASSAWLVAVTNGKEQCLFQITEQR